MKHQLELMFLHFLKILIKNQLVRIEDFLTAFYDRDTFSTAGPPFHSRKNDNIGGGVLCI
ncbi:hypothetical protein CHCC14820_2372 [Bacillus paralicheniformis]|nr:hypothetical protein B4123_3888 [Bacillus paralicheniformis]TWJ62995.1 hypothetical protein CHCC5021_1455 [Bacillus paralicheniformis]TWJ79330.1 hypothetical protein CHCC5019_0293 [Bacillus paralicheniformis]TWL20282.1 hypothetical protein CHCC19467_1754 [Bacillus paralicheniformis]TWL35661.1 hypothetical protein CHCC15337_4227 [Bacillus paralicheniformis]